MSRPNNKLELNWVGKEERPRLEPRILVEDKSQSYHASTRRDADLFDNRLIEGDNLLALKALEAEFTGKIKCVFIDPPYNTGSAFQHYDDGVEHSLWLSMMRDRLELLHRLLSDDGSIWVTLDDNEVHYFKIMCDEIFGRKNFITSVIWQKVYTVKNSARHFSSMHDYVIVYAKNAETWKINLLKRSAQQDDAYTNPDKDPRGPWKATPLHARNYYSLGRYSISSPTGRLINPPSGTYWRISEQNFKQLDADKQIWWGESGNNIPAQKRFLSDVKQGVTPSTFWSYQDAGHNAEAKNELRAILPTHEELFLTPKPERLIGRILELATNKGDLVLDSFAGSGTTGAVAHKMGRRWIMVELGGHASTHIVPRLRKVIDGTDSGGVTQVSGWQSGGGFRFYRLAPSLLEKDRWGNWVISKEYNPAMLAEAMCKHMGFIYAPSHDPSEYWNHGSSSERDFIFVTTNALTHEMLEAISYDVGPDRHLLICCKAFSTKKLDKFQNLTMKRIPHAILDTCEWGRDDYSLRIANLPETNESSDVSGTQTPSRASRSRVKRQDQGGPGLFDEPAVVEG